LCAGREISSHGKDSMTNPLFDRLFARHAGEEQNVFAIG
jgi:hypothetical protein